MTSSHPMESGLADAVRAGAAGLYSLEAACELVIGTGWLHRDDFARFVSTGTSLTDCVTELAHIDWQSVISSRDAGLFPAAAGRTGSREWQPVSPPASPSTSTTPSADSTRPASTSSSALSVTRTDSVPPISPDPDDMTCVTCKTGNRHTARHHQRETSALGSARQNRYTDSLHTASAERRHFFATEAIMNGMPPHIAQLVLGHKDITTTMGYKAVYPDEAIQAHRAFIARRRVPAARPRNTARRPKRNGRSSSGTSSAAKSNSATAAAPSGPPASTSTPA